MLLWNMSISSTSWNNIPFSSEWIDKFFYLFIHNNFPIFTHSTEFEKFSLNFSNKKNFFLPSFLTYFLFNPISLVRIHCVFCIIFEKETHHFDVAKTWWEFTWVLVTSAKFPKFHLLIKQRFFQENLFL